MFSVTTSPSASPWFKAQSMPSHGPFPPGTTLCLDVRRGNEQKTVSYDLPDDRLGRYAWPLAFGDYVNAASRDVQVGENQSGTIVPIGSSYRNALWLAREDATVALRIELPSAFLRDADASFARLVAARKAADPGHDTVHAWKNALNEEGRFLDIAYPALPTDVQEVAPLVAHLARIHGMASHIQNHPEDADVVALVEAALRAMDHFVRTGYSARNWWYDAIGFAKVLAASAALLAPRAPVAFMASYATYAARRTNVDDKNMKGANLADLCSVQVTWSLAVWRNTGNPLHLTYALNASRLLSGLCARVPRPEEGFAWDDMITAHNTYGVQLSTNAYGPELVGRICENAALLMGGLAIETDALARVAAFLVNGAGRTFFHGMADFHACGRGMSRRTSSATLWANATDVCLSQGVGDAALLEELKRRITSGETTSTSFRGNRAYWVSDYMAHFGERLGGWIKTCSTRTVSSESGNGENLQAYYMGCGTALVLSHGDDYRDIQPLWDWQRLPGTTVEQVPAFDFPLIDWGAGAGGSHAFAGAVSDGTSGINTMTLSRRNVREARKTVAAHGDTFCFIGSDIDLSAARYPVVTTVDQVKPGNDPITVWHVDGSSQQMVAPADISGTDIVAVTLGDRKRYDFPPLPAGDVVEVSLKVQSGRWKDINAGGSPDRVEAVVLTLGIRHLPGRLGSYRYAIGLGKERAAGVGGAGSMLRIDGVAHVITLREGHVAVVAFEAMATPYDLGNGRGVRALQPCAFLARRDGEAVVITAADIAQASTSLLFEIVVGGVPHRVEAAVPLGEERGKSTTFTWRPPSL